MTKQDCEIRQADVLIIGSGIAGLLLASELTALNKNCQIVLATKGQLDNSNTAYAQGGLAAVVKANNLDSPELHLQDTLRSGAGLANEHVARLMIEEGASLVCKLQELGVPFDANKCGNNSRSLSLAREGGHSRARILHNKDASGRAIVKALIAQVNGLPNTKILTEAFLLELIQRNLRCTGAHFLTPDKAVTIIASHVVLATGGLGCLFARTTNPPQATGDGIACAYRAGARLIDMEFVQFHPTALAQNGAPSLLISEAVRGAGGVLVDKFAERFCLRFHAAGELATRDIVARSIHRTMIEQEIPCVWLDMKPIGSKRMQQQFPNIVNALRSFGIDPTQELIPVSPAAHYFMGGIFVDENGQTTIPGLYAIGECASTGFHGANRLASNSLLESGVMALRLAKHLNHLPAPSRLYLDSGSFSVVELQDKIPDTVSYPMATSLSALKQQMFCQVGLEREGETLERLIAELNKKTMMQAPASCQEAIVANATLLAWLIARAALVRCESRGAHFRSDFPALNDQKYLKRYYLQKDNSGWLNISKNRIFELSYVNG